MLPQSGLFAGSSGNVRLITKNPAALGKISIKDADGKAKMIANIVTYWYNIAGFACRWFNLAD